VWGGWNQIAWITNPRRSRRTESQSEREPVGQRADRVIGTCFAQLVCREVVRADPDACNPSSVGSLDIVWRVADHERLVGGHCFAVHECGSLQRDPRQLARSLASDP
jgi:hypothetical protein